MLFAASRAFRSAIALIRWSTSYRDPLYVREDSGTHRYNVGTDTPKLCATSCGGVPLASSFLAAWTLPYAHGFFYRVWCGRGEVFLGGDVNLLRAD